MKVGLTCFRQLVVCTLLITLLSLQSKAQTATMTGTVLDEKGAVMANVTVTAINAADTASRFATTTNINGIFTFNQLRSGTAYHFRFSFVSYQRHDVNDFMIRANESNSIMVKMTPAPASNLEEVVHVGYGTQKKMNLSGAVQQVSGEELRDRPATNITSLLQGVMPNLNIRMSSGTPGQMGSFSIRGIASTGGPQEPLVIIDGVPGTLDRLSPEEVESISVLKDASVAAIYGARGAFGVILITTKTGKSGKTVVRYNNYFGYSTPTVSTDFLTTAYDWMKLNDAALAHIGGYSGYTDKDYQELYARRNDKTEDPSRPWITIQNRNGKDQYVYYGNYDWWDIMFTKWQASQSHNISISGGSETFNYMINGNLRTKDGIMRMNTDNYGSKQLRTKLSARLTPWLKVSNNTNIFHNSYEYQGREGGGSSNFVNINVHASPAYAPRNPDGTATYRTGLNNYDIGDGLFAMLVEGHTRGVSRTYELTTINEATITPLKNWNITSNYSFNLYTDPSYYRQTPATYSLYPGVEEVTPKYSVDMLKETQYFNQRHVVNLFTDYTSSFSKVHHLKLLAGYNQELLIDKSLRAERNNLTADDLNDLNLGTGEQRVYGGSGEVALMGFFYRVSYDYKGKYILETNGRYDGSSRFPKKDRWGFFPSMSVAWRISQENFFEPLRGIVSDLKLRGSIGQLGNQVVSSRYPYISSMNPGTAAYILDGVRANYYSPANPVSASLTWEKATTYNGGIDVALFQNKLNISFDKYVRITNDILDAGVKIPNVYGATQPAENVASIETKGFELSVNYRNQFKLLSKAFTYGFTVALGDNYSTVREINNPTAIAASLYKGKRMGEIWGYITDGFFATDEEAANYPINQTFLNRGRLDNNIRIKAGDLRWIDLDGNNIINQGANTVKDPGDQKVIGNSTQRYMYSLGGNLSWNNIDISFLFQGLGKMDWYPGNNADRFWGPYSRPYYTFLPKDFEKDIYSADNPNAYFPNLMAYVALNANNELRATNNRYLQNLAYLRLKNLTIGYTLPVKLTQKAKIQGLRFFASGENIFTTTKLRSKYIDPEQAMANIDGRVYPFSKTYSVGVDITL